MRPRRPALAVVLAGGRGSRFLPFTKVVPKEMLPLGPTPAIDYVIDECIQSNIKQIILVTRPGDRLLRSHLSPTPSNMTFFEERPSSRYGSAVPLLQLAECLEGESAFAVLFADDIIVGNPPGLQEVIDAFVGFGAAGAVAIQRTPRSRIVGRFGSLALRNALRGGPTSTWEIEDLVQQPTVAGLRSDFAVVSRLVLTPSILRKIAAPEPEELDIGTALARLAKTELVIGVEITGQWMTVGDPVSYRDAIIRSAFNVPSLRQRDRMNESLPEERPDDVPVRRSPELPVDVPRLLSLLRIAAGDTIIGSGSMMEGDAGCRPESEIHVFTNRSLNGARPVELHRLEELELKVEYVSWSELEGSLRSIARVDLVSSRAALNVPVPELDLIHRIRRGQLIYDPAGRLALALGSLDFLKHERTLFYRALHRLDSLYDDAMDAIESRDLVTAWFLARNCVEAVIDARLATAGDTSVKARWRWRRMVAAALEPSWFDALFTADVPSAGQAVALAPIVERLRWVNRRAEELSFLMRPGLTDQCASTRVVGTLGDAVFRPSLGARLRRYPDAVRLVDRGKQYLVDTALAHVWQQLDGECPLGACLAASGLTLDTAVDSAQMSFSDVFTNLACAGLVERIA